MTSSPSPLPARYMIDLFCDQRWVGHCIVDQHSIAQCYLVQLGPSGRETDQILAQIQAALAEGQDCLDWNGHRFAWRAIYGVRSGASLINGP